MELYLNNIYYLLSSQWIGLFAVDTLLLISNININEALEQMQYKVKRDLQRNKLLLNLNKRKMMIIASKYQQLSQIDYNKTNIKIGNESLEINTEV